MQLGYEDEDSYPLSEVSFDVWKELQRRGHVERVPKRELRLTAKGQKASTGLESGIDMPKFDYTGEVAQ
jgi:hypothetical protein